MKISEIRPSEKLASFLHFSFNIIYVLLVMQFVLTLNEKPFELSDLSNQPPKPFFILAVNRLADILVKPFEYYDSFTIVMVLISYAVFHYGMFLKISEERKNELINKFLDLCRAIFFLAGTLLLLLLIARVGVMLYFDFTVGRPVIAIETPKK